MMAITKRIWIKPPTCQTKAPNNQPITRITAITYNRFPIIFEFEKVKKNVIDKGYIQNFAKFFKLEFCVNFSI